MPENQDRLQYLLEGYVEKTLSWKEMQELFEYVERKENREAVLAFMEAAAKEIPVSEEVEEIDWTKMYQNITGPGQKRIVIWRRWVAVAAVLLITLGVYFIVADRSFVTPSAKAIAERKVVPGGNKAILRLADGSEIVLDSARNGVLARRQDLTITKTKDGQLLYDASGNEAETGKTIRYNTLSTPKGGQYQIILPDGTKVWLNAASSLRFPTSFAGNERIVELEGEAYFEVEKASKDIRMAGNTAEKRLPFIVKSKGQRITVLGTRFNVMAYEDEPVWKTTLLEGKVSVSKGVQSNVLQPGQQARISKTGNIEVLNSDPEEAMAWKEGYFRFDRADLQSIMRQIARWYDVEVVYEGNIMNDEYVGEIRRSANLSEILRVLELSHLHFRMENRKLIVTP